MAFVAKDAKGFQKSLGGDVFTASWARAGDDEPATHGTASTVKVVACLIGSAVLHSACDKPDTHGTLPSHDMRRLPFLQSSAARCLRYMMMVRLSCIIPAGEIRISSHFI